MLLPCFLFQIFLFEYQPAEIIAEVKYIQPYDRFGNKDRLVAYDFFPKYVSAIWLYFKNTQQRSPRALLADDSLFRIMYT